MWSTHELLITKFRLKLRKVGETTRPFRYALNQIPYDYTVEVRNRFKGLDLIDRVMNYGMRFETLYRRQGSRPSPWKRNAKKAKWLSGEALQIAVKRREVKSKGEKERYKHLNAECWPHYCMANISRGVEVMTDFLVLCPKVTVVSD